MDEKFLEFFGNSLINMARAKKQGDDVARFMGDWFSPGTDTQTEKICYGVDDISELFRKVYGLAPQATDPDRRGTFEQKKMTEDALSNFQDAFKAHLDALGFVSKERHLELVEKYETLKSEHFDQKETIDNLKMLLKSRGREGDSFNPNEIVKNQQDLFQEMIKNFSGFLSETSKNPDKEPA